MKILCSRRDLARALSIVRYGEPRCATVPIANDVLLAADGGRFRLMTCTPEFSVTHWADARVEESGEIVVSLHDLRQVVNSLPPRSSVALETSEDNLILALSCDTVTASFQRITDEFPLVPAIGDAGDGVVVEAGDLRLGLEQVTFAASRDETYPVLMGVLMEFTSSTLKLVASDGFRLSMRYVPLVKPVKHPFSVIVSAWALEKLMHIITRRNEPVTISMVSNWVVFTLRDTVLSSRLIDGTFPNYRRIISTIARAHHTRAVINRGELLQACKRAAAISTDFMHKVRLNIELEQITVSVASAESSKGSTTLSASVEGASMEILFNARFLIDILSILDAPQVVLLVSKPTDPCVIKAPGDEEAFTHVIMPILPNRK